MKFHLPLSLRSALLSCLSLLPLASFILSPPLRAEWIDSFGRLNFENETASLSGEYTESEVNATNSYLKNNSSINICTFFNLYGSSTLMNKGRIDLKGDRSKIFIEDHSSLYNSGTINLGQFPPGGILLQGYSTLTNTGTIKGETEIGTHYNTKITNNGLIDIANAILGFYNDGELINNGTIKITADYDGIGSTYGTISNNINGKIHITAKRNGIRGDMVNYGTVIIKMAGGAESHGVVVENRITNYGILKTDDIVMSDYYADLHPMHELLLMHGSTTGSSTEGKPLLVDGNEGIVILGGGVGRK